MNELRKKWVDALRSGKYKQGTGCLRNTSNHFCCLGVLCDIYGEGLWISAGKNDQYFFDLYNEQTAEILPNYILNAVGISSNDQEALMAMNDSGDSFESIAKVLEAPSTQRRGGIAAWPDQIDDIERCSS